MSARCLGFDAWNAAPKLFCNAKVAVLIGDQHIVIIGIPAGDGQHQWHRQAEWQQGKQKKAEPDRFQNWGPWATGRPIARLMLVFNVPFRRGQGKGRREMMKVFEAGCRQRRLNCIDFDLI